MIQGVIQLMLGEAGRALANGYAHFAIVINGLVLCYALVILWSHHCLRASVMEMEALMVETASEFGSEDISAIYTQFIARWCEKNGRKKYLLPSKRDLWWEAVKGSDLASLLQIDADYLRLAIHKNNGEPAKQEFSPFLLLALQEHRHNLLTGRCSQRKDAGQLEAGYQKRLQKTKKKARQRLIAE